MVTVQHAQALLASGDIRMVPQKLESSHTTRSFKGYGTAPADTTMAQNTKSDGRFDVFSGEARR